MADSHVISALKEKRARLAGELQTAKLRVMALQLELGSVDNCLIIFRSDVDPASIPAKVTLSPSQLPKGAATRTALDSRGGFTAAFLIQCLEAVGCFAVHLNVQPERR